MTESRPASALNPNLLWRALHWPCWALGLTWLRVKCSGLENVDHTKGGLLLINHQSFLDPLLVALWLTRPVSYLARSGLAAPPYLCDPDQSRSRPRGQYSFGIGASGAGIPDRYFSGRHTIIEYGSGCFPTRVSGDGAADKAACLSRRDRRFRLCDATWRMVYPSGKNSDCLRSPIHVRRDGERGVRSRRNLL